jgi:hypothetical protein
MSMASAVTASNSANWSPAAAERGGEGRGGQEQGKGGGRAVKEKSVEAVFPTAGMPCYRPRLRPRHLPARLPPPTEHLHSAPTPGPGQPGHSLTDALALAASKGEVLEVVGGLVGHGGVHGEAVWVEGVGLIPQLGGPAAGGGET